MSVVEARGGLGAADLLRVWELGGPMHPIDRALLMCAVAAPAERESVASLSLGERDARLLSLRARTFGDRVAAVIDCPACGAGLDLVVSIGELYVAPRDAADRIVVDGREITLRKLDSQDLAAVASVADPDAARTELVARAVVGDVGELSEAARTAIAERLGELDPQADLVFDLTCAECAHAFAVPFDVASFLWTEISIEARTLMQEVAALARAFHWSEAEILGMSRRRRHRYLELAEA